jgi:hypothetical protein
MAINQIVDLSQQGPERNTFKVRLPYLYQAKHNNDEFKNLGYNYRGQILKRITSPELWSNPLQTPLIGQIESMMTYILEQAKMVKKWMSIAHDKDSLNVL